MKLSSTSPLSLKSPAFQEGGYIPAIYTCKGENINPPLSISGIPNETKSLTLIMDDPDAPNGVWDHWIVFNISPKVSEIPEGTEPQGIHGAGSSGDTSYQGPCPPSGTHRYIFTLYSLDSELALKEGAKKSDVIQAMNGHIISQAVLMGKFAK